MIALQLLLWGACWLQNSRPSKSCQPEMRALSGPTISTVIIYFRGSWSCGISLGVAAI